VVRGRWSWRSDWLPALSDQGKGSLLASRGERAVRPWLMWQLRPTSFTLNGKTVGILGLGRIGRHVAVRCRAFGAELYYHDVLRAKPEAEKELGVRFVTRDELLSLSDVVTLHLPLTATTNRCFGENEFRLMKSSAIFINTARGAL